MADTTGGVDQNDIIVAGTREGFRPPGMEKGSSGSSSGDPTIPDLLPSLTSRQQATIQAEIDSHRGQNVGGFLFDINVVVMKEAPHVAKTLQHFSFGGSHSEGFKAWVERVKSQTGNILEIFTYPPLLEVLEQLPARPVPPQYRDGGDQMDATREAWRVDYVGQTATLLRKAINQMNADRGNKEYANFVPIVQSSGTGKSRAVDELARHVFTLPFNLRPPQDTSGYPEGDHGLLRCLCPGINSSPEKPSTAVELYLRYNIFFKCLFEAVEKEVLNMKLQESSEALALVFYNWLTQNRSELYASVITETEKECSATNEQVESINSSGLRIQQVWKSLKALMKQTAIAALKVGERLVEHIKERSSKGTNTAMGIAPVWLVLYFDESHPLTAMRPSPDDGKDFTAYQILCGTLDKFRDLDLFAVFLSTSSSLSSHPPPQGVFWSSRPRVSDAPGVQATFIELPFDKYNGECLLKEDSHTLQDVCHPKHMVRFGRPLFWTRYQCGDDEVRNDVIEFACVKLAPESRPLATYLPEESRASLAILSVRLGLAFDHSRPSSREVSNRLVEGHMHMVFAATRHREYMHIGPSSEPILAEAAAQIMHRQGLHRQAANLLSDWFNEGLLSKGDREELVLRLLLTLAHDRAIQLQSRSSFTPPPKKIPVWPMPSEPIPPVRSFSRPISLPNFLVALLGDTHAKSILESKPDNIPGGVTLAESELGQAQLNFTHWGKAEDSSVVTDDAAWVALGRCMAWQCSHNQWDIDHITPLLLWDEKLGRYNVSAIFWQTKTRLKSRPVDIDAEKLKFFTPHPDPENRANIRPYLTIVVDLGVKAKDPPTIITSQDKRMSHRTSTKLRSHPRYTATIFGCSAATYPGVIRRGIDTDAYSILLAPEEWFAEHPRRDPEFLEAIADMKPLWGHRRETTGSYSGICFTGDNRLTKSNNKAPTSSTPIDENEYPEPDGTSEICTDEADGVEDEDREQMASPTTAG